MTRGKKSHEVVAAGALVGLRPPDAPAATARPSPDHPTLQLRTRAGATQEGGIFSFLVGGKFGVLLTRLRGKTPAQALRKALAVEELPALTYSPPTEEDAIDQAEAA